MNGAQGLPQKAWRVLARLEPFLDLILPIGTALLLLDQRTLAYGLIYGWLLLRLLLQTRNQSSALWLLLGLALVNAGTVVMDRGGQPSDPSDLLVIVLAFAAGLERTSQQWQRSFAQICCCLAPITLMALIKPANQLLAFPGINVNRMSFLLGMLLLCAWGIARLSQHTAARLGWFAIASLGLPLALATGSRAALAAPMLALLVAWLIRAVHAGFTTKTFKRGNLLTAGLSLILLGTIAIGSLQAWYGTSHDSRTNQLSDAMRFPTAQCWATAPFHAGKELLGLGYNQKVRKRCDGHTLPILKQAGRLEGLPHAHNAAAQILAETGLAGLMALLAAVAWSLQATLRGLAPSRDQPLMRELILPLMVYFLLTGMTTSFQIYLVLNQVLIGYSLAALTSPLIQQQPTQPQREGC